MSALSKSFEGKQEVKITLVKSTIGSIPKHRKTVQALGLRKINSNVVRPNSKATWGMIEQVIHLVKVTES